jgi:SAM-dependent methyltransferase
VAPGAPQLAAGIRGDMTDRERLLDALRPVSFAIAYRMLGSVSEAEDIVQEALVRLHRALEDGVQVRSQRARAPATGPDRKLDNVSGLPSVSLIAHTDLPFANPMAEEAVDEAVAALPLCADPRVVDAGCGSGEILMRVLRAHPGARGVGVDLDPDAIAAALARAGDSPVRFEVRDAATLGGSFDAVLNVASSHALGGFPGVLEAMRALAPAALYGDGFWQRPPAPAFLAALGEATEDELADLDGLRQAISDASFEILDEWFASDSDWQHYEETLAANAEHHGTPEALAYAHRIRERRALPDGTDTLGFGLFVLLRH